MKYFFIVAFVISWALHARADLVEGDMAPSPREKIPSAFENRMAADVEIASCMQKKQTDKVCECATKLSHHACEEDAATINKLSEKDKEALSKVAISGITERQADILNCHSRCAMCITGLVTICQMKCYFSPNSGGC